MLEVKKLTVEFGPLRVVDELSFKVERGQWLMLVGPNGAGKSTVVNALSQGVSYGGEVLFDGEELSKRRPAALARIIGVLSQNHSVSYSFTVREVVRLGRYSHSRGLFAPPRDGDNELIERALEAVGMLENAEQSVLTLSGGELQRTFLAQLFAQDPRVLILDEPTNHLDLVYQRQVFELIKRWVSEAERAVISVVHDLSLARAYGTHAVLLEHGRAAACGRVDEVFTREGLRDVYSIDVYEWMTAMLSQWRESQL